MGTGGCDDSVLWGCHMGTGGQGGHGDMGMWEMGDMGMQGHGDREDLGTWACRKS